MAKTLVFNTPKQREAHDKIRSGIKQLSDAVKITLGPSGRVVMYEREYGDPVITKDGVTVAKQVELSDPLENMAASMVRQAAARTAATAGDGTTTATIYTEAIFEAGIKGVQSGANPHEVKRGIDRAVALVIAELQKAAKTVVDIEQIKQVAICSANQDVEIGTMIAQAMEKVGKDGVITIEEGRAIETTISVVDGLQLPRGYISPQFATDPETLLCEFEDPAILITDQKIDDLKLMLKILELAYKQLGNKPFVIIADDFSDDCTAALVLNKLKVGLNVVGIKSPGFGDRRRSILEDIAIATGATLLCKEGVNLSQLTATHLGHCKKIKIDRDTTTIIEGSGDDAKVAERITLLRNQLEKVAGDFDREKVQERLARLAGGIAQICVGGATEVEVREKKDRIDDALHACKAATEEGILPGGGVAVIHAAKKIITESQSEDFKMGMAIVFKALEAPIRQIAVNTGEDDGVILSKVKESADNNFGFNAITKQYGDMIKFGIIVPTKVERIALQNAASVAGLLLATDCMIAIQRDRKAADPAAPFPSLG